ncbi:transposase [Adhaeribacter soli]|uniref:Transposase n=1 Tax=Adhaeribacter soli TaxID=2607655 RepID=A0A5N1J7N1_9BACT|nr:transposase [Adhaeribacter soli]KAA9346113.1 transposase [Adhaeribacter soli]
MAYNPQLHHRRSIRLPGYDYAQNGLYFLTLCVQDQKHLFGHIAISCPASPIVQTMILNEASKMIETEWLKIPERFPQTILHEYIVMPNHFHAILEITNQRHPVGAPLVGAQLSEDAQLPVGTQIPAGTQLPNIKTTVEVQTAKKGQPQGIAPTGLLPTESIRENSPAANSSAKTIGDIVGAFKSITTNAYIKGVKNLEWPPFSNRLWQRDYWEHIIRNEKAYDNISNYIATNPINWDSDSLKYPPNK